jgi:hypothetical protein
MRWNPMNKELEIGQTICKIFISFTR